MSSPVFGGESIWCMVGAQRVVISLNCQFFCGGKFSCPSTSGRCLSSSTLCGWGGRQKSLRGSWDQNRKFLWGPLHYMNWSKTWSSKVKQPPNTFALNFPWWCPVNFDVEVHYVKTFFSYIYSVWAEPGGWWFPVRAFTGQQWCRWTVPCMLGKGMGVHERTGGPGGQAKCYLI